jgi:hypothetical protein
MKFSLDLYLCKSLAQGTVQDAVTLSEHSPACLNFP